MILLWKMMPNEDADTEEDSEDTELRQRKAVMRMTLIQGRRRR